jgi:hypothetical protein
MTAKVLSQILLPPSMPIETSGSWDNVENQLGTKLPQDYKDFIEVFGSGIIGRFVTVLNPFSSRPGLNLIVQSKLQLAALSVLRDNFSEPNPYKLYPANGGLLPVAITDNGDVVHWLTTEDVTGWTMVVNEARSPDFQHFACNLTTFLAGILNKSITCRAFPNCVFLNETEFEVV